MSALLRFSLTRLGSREKIFGCSFPFFLLSFLILYIKTQVRYSTWEIEGANAPSKSKSWSTYKSIYLGTDYLEIPLKVAKRWQVIMNGTIVENRIVE